jgi:hypothetical protein
MKTYEPPRKAIFEPQSRQEREENQMFTTEAQRTPRFSQRKCDKPTDLSVSPKNVGGGFQPLPMVNHKEREVGA